MPKINRFQAFSNQVMRKTEQKIGEAIKNRNNSTPTMPKGLSRTQQIQWYADNLGYVPSNLTKPRGNATTPTMPSGLSRREQMDWYSNNLGYIPSSLVKVRKSDTPSNTAIKNTPAVSNKPSTHTIAAGETLGGIAKKYGVDWRQLAKDNGIDNPNLIIAGRKLNINGATKKPAKRKQRRELSEQLPLPSRKDFVKQLAPIAAPSDDVAPAYRGATNPYTSPKQLWI